MTFARLLLPQLLPQISGKLLYLDSDILVIGGLARLCAADLGDAVVGAVLDRLDGCIKSNKCGLEKFLVSVDTSMPVYCLSTLVNGVANKYRKRL